MVRSGCSEVGLYVLVMVTLVVYMNLERCLLDMNFMTGACFLMHAHCAWQAKGPSYGIIDVNLVFMRPYIRFLKGS